MNIMQGAILGLVQGLGEFLPISSSGHLFLARLIMGIDAGNPAYKILDILLHVGTLIPIIVVFWRDWIDMIAHPIRNKTLLYLFCASLPALVFYLVFDYDMFDSGWALAPSFILTAILLLLMDIVSSCRKKVTGKVTLGKALIMGFMQGIGLLPGVSRSGSTMFGGVLSGLDRKSCARFSFMMSAPAIVASLLVEGKHALDEHLFESLDMAPTIVAVLVACVVGYLTIRFMLKIITWVPMSWFGIYLVLLAIVILLLQLAGYPSLPAFTVPEGMSILALSL